MKKENDDELGFVLRNYREGAFDPESALKKMKNRRSTRRSPTLRRWVAMAASLLCLVAFAAVLTLNVISSGDSRNTMESGISVNHEKTEAETVTTFHFDDTPLPQVLSELSSHYGVPLEASDTARHLTGDFTSESLDATIQMIEEVLNVTIVQQR